MSKYYKKILVYGTGYVAGELMDRFKKLNLSVVGVLDRVKIDGIFKGAPILEWRDIDADMADAIFIAAPNKYCKEIYFRILPFCMAREIEILDAGGNSLTSYFGVGITPRPYGCYAESYDEIFKQIDTHDIISFDVFDTLLIRDVMDPLDVFSYTESQMTGESGIYRRFRKHRRTAELQCNFGNIDEIYIEIQKAMGLSNVQRDMLKRKELESEEELLQARESVIRLLDYAKLKNKKVIAVSDMYLPEVLLCGILERKGIKGVERVFVSCDHKRSKTDGLFEAVIKQYHTRSIFHIGDDLDADVKAPRKLGLHSIGIMKTVDMMKQTSLGRTFGHITTLADSLWMGRISNLLFDNIFADRRSVNIRSVEIFIKIYFLPFIDLYISKICDLIKINHYDGILFPARDGFILHKCYELLRQERLIDGPKSYYIICSRKLLFRSFLENENELETVIRFFWDENISRTAKKVFGISENMAEHKQSEGSDSHLSDKKLREEIFGAIEKGNEIYSRYLHSIGISKDGKYLFCELDGQGTSEYYFNNYFNGNMDAVYLERTHLLELYNSDSNNIYDNTNMDREYSSIYNYLVVMENLFTSPKASVIGINPDGTFEYDADDRSSDEIEFLHTLHTKVIELMVEHFKEQIKFGELSNKLVQRMFETISEVELSSECEFVKRWRLKDEMTGNILDSLTAR